MHLFYLGDTVLRKFRAVSVFDVSQTDGKPIPELEALELLSTVEGYEDFCPGAYEYFSCSDCILKIFPAIPKGISVQQKNGLLFRKI